MAFSVSALQSDILTVFNSMRDNATNRDFALGISNAIVKFVSTGQVSTTDAGSVIGIAGVGGMFTGSGNGTLTVTPTACADIIESACNYMNSKSSDTSFNGADYLADKIAEAVQKMADDGIVNTNVNGRLITTSSPPTVIEPYPGTAKGTINCSSAPIPVALKRLFSEMWSKRLQQGYDGNLEFAKELAKEINSFWLSGSITTNGLVHLTGSTGTGSIS